jgi:putative salt-induced outer membrane protein YdiY
VSEVRYGESDGRRFRDAAFAHLRYNYRFGGPLVAEVFTQLERDSFALLNLRALVGAGLRLRLLETEPARLFLGITPMFERERLDANQVGAHPAQTNALRISQYLNARLRLSDRTFLISTTYVQPWVAVPADVRLLNETRLGVGITEALTLRITLNTRYDSRPPGAVSDWTLSWTNGLTFTW